MFNRCLAICGVVLGLILSSCTYKRPAVEQPAPNRQRVEKSFFADAASGEYTAQSGRRWKSKRFVCGWAAEDTAGKFGHAVFDHYNFADHCNIEFEITKDALIGKLVQASFPDEENRWPKIVSIPILRHYYVERKKDSRGRDLNEEIENADRSDFDARPYMDLDFARVQILDPWVSPIPGGTLGTSADDVEWDGSRSFLGFTLNAISRDYGSLVQARLRFNFMGFKSDPEFTAKQKTRYHQDNSKYFNALHIIGRKLEGVHQELFTAKWNIEKTHEIHIVDFPPEYEFIGHDTVRLWNDMFQKISGKRPFVSKSAKRKYHFDLRYPSIVWVADKRMSYNGPLGVALVTSDVSNGEVLWGTSVIWGGALENYLRAYLPPTSYGGTASMAYTGSTAAPSLQLSLGLPELAFQIPRPEIPVAPSAYGPAPARELFKELLSNTFARDFKSPGLSAPDLIKNGPTQLDIDSYAYDFLKRGDRFHSQFKQAFDARNAPEEMQKLLGQPTLQQSLASLPLGTRDLLPGEPNSLSPDRIAQGIKDRIVRAPAIHDLDRTFSNSALGWRMGLNTVAGISVEKALPGVVKDILLHEMGHMIGLGHNFKENILPEPGTVPEVHYAHLKKESEREYRNYSTVMGYKHGLTDLTMEYDELVPAIHDELVLRYIYNRQVSTYQPGDKDFKFVNLPTDGRIRTQFRVGGQSVRPAYLPQCNDFEASLALDPYCNRWDRGHDAKTLIQTYFNDYKATIVAQLQSFSSAINRPAPWTMEYMLWDRSINTFGRTRLFYDYMRQRYAPTLREYVVKVDSKGERNLLDFSAACAVANGEIRDIENQELIDLLNAPQNEKIKDLCQAINIYFREMQQLVKLPGGDFTTFDRNNRVIVSAVTGGDIDLNYSKAFGTWKEMARAPIKISALYASLLPYPTQLFYGWLLPVHTFEGRDGYFHLSTLYPREYTQLIAATVENNVGIGNINSGEPTRMGRAILALGQLLPYSYFTNDKFEVEAAYSENLRKQTRFDYNFAVIEVTKREIPGEDVVKKFTAQMYTLFSNSRPETLRHIFLYTRDRVIAEPSSGSLIYPLSPIRWYSANTGYYYALRVDYPVDDPSDNLRTRSVKKAIEDTYKSVLKVCIEGTQGEVPNSNGLRYFFDEGKSQFTGFTFTKQIHTNPVDKDNLFRSVEKQFETYYSNPGQMFKVAPDPRACTEALRGQGLLVSTAAALNGFFLPEVINYIEMGQ